MFRSLRRALPALLIVPTLALAACGSDDDDKAPASTAASAEGTATLTIGGGADAPVEGEILEFVRDTVAPDHDLKLNIELLGDSVALNEAVNGGELDGHVAQPWPYLQGIKDERGWKVEPAAPVYVSKFIVFSKKHDSLDALPDGAQVALPDDPSSQARALGILADAGVIELDSGVDPFEVSVRDVTENPKNLKWQPVTIAQVARAIDDVDAAIGPAAIFAEAGVEDSARIHEPKEHPAHYAIQLIVGEGRVSDPGVVKLIAAFEDPRVAEFVNERFGQNVAGVAAGQS